MLLGALGPWAQFPGLGSASVSGFEHGSSAVLVAAMLVLLLELIGRGRAAPLIGALSAAWTALVMYELPGDLVAQGASEAQVAWGALAALLGGGLVTAGIARGPRPVTDAPVRRAALALVGAAITGGLVLVAWAGLYGTVSSVDSRTWVRHARDEIRLASADGRARAVAAVTWHHGSFPAGFRHRGVFTQESVAKARPSIACVWIRIEWGYPLGVASAPTGSYIVRCKARGERRPIAVSLAGLGYTKGLLRSATITLCVSHAKADGPRFCGTQKVTYSRV